MCGILFSVQPTGSNLDEQWQTLKAFNTKRGPDAQVQMSVDHGKWTLHFFSSVLHLRGPSTVAQPLQDKHTGDVLCWNGEVFGGLDVPFGSNDTSIVMDMLEKMNDFDTEDQARTYLLKLVARIEGPFAFVFWHQRFNNVWFSRDCLGRRSLLWRQDPEKFMLSSVAANDSAIAWEEIPSQGVYRLKLSPSDSLQPELHPWSFDPVSELTMPFDRLNTAVPTDQDLQPVADVNDMPAICASMETTMKDMTRTLDLAVQRRVADIPHLSSSSPQPRVAILFSGGLDCIALAALVHRHLPVHEPIDLLNVAFENPRSVQARQNQKRSATNTPVRSTYDTPDRLTGKSGVQELRDMAPERQWHFVEVNVPFEEAMSYKQRIIDRMYPLDTVMDLSIAMALWFAARGKGLLNGNEYQSEARVLISGLGADEQLGGYSRHREAYKRGSWSELIKETQLDVDRISTRNLGRDDRIISDHGKEARFPFLDTDLVRYLCQVPIQLKMDMRYERGVGEKLLLRHIVHQLGLPLASRNWKRAIQFGAKSAKMTDDDRGQKGQHKLA
ncbi:hypothetical protein DM01DRAFT_1338005 [Hesseltinella vesiculosa]|uniref:Glutamine amidotransferase type-2 domain-containing protein n=1 Tax=Hesseltinella vesiculosa TaxID=101127 RepID=A0A1X2GBF2_9FUNG|nr:hypothetical protein DM01DRAFT_1338005 [Hesseltinella vesiculosa]